MGFTKKLEEKILAKIKTYDAPNLNGMLGLSLSWLPAFGLLPEDSPVWGIMKAGFFVLVLLSLYAWLCGLQRRKSRAILYVGVWLIPFFWTLLIYYARIIEHFHSTFHQTVPLVLLNAVLFTLVSVRWFIEIYRSHQSRLRQLRQRGLLRRYKILDEGQGIFRMMAELPGLNGNSPEKEMERQIARWRWLSVLPISGIIFFLLRTVSGSIGWIMFFVCVGWYAIVFPLFVKTLALWMELWEWEWDLDKKIYIAGKEKFG